MPAPKGNKYAVGNKGGRPSAYKPEYCDQIVEYFRREPINVLYKKEYNKDGSLKSETPIMTAVEFPTFQGFAAQIGVAVPTLLEWCEIHEEFSKAYARAKELQESIWLVNSMGNLYNAQFAQFFGKNCLGYKDKQEIEQTGNPALLQFVNVSNLSQLDTSDLQNLEQILSKVQQALPESEE